MIKQFITVRNQAIKQMLDSSTIPEDIVFTEKNGNVSINLIPYEEKFPPSHKYNIRKQVVAQLLKGGIISNNKSLDKIYFFSYDSIMSVDYCFEITPMDSKCVLYIIKDEKIIRRYNPYDLSYDERNDISYIC